MRGLFHLAVLLTGHLTERLYRQTSPGNLQILWLRTFFILEHLADGVDLCLLVLTEKILARRIATLVNQALGTTAQAQRDADSSDDQCALHVSPNQVGNGHSAAAACRPG